MEEGRFSAASDANTKVGFSPCVRTRGGVLRPIRPFLWIYRQGAGVVAASRRDTPASKGYNMLRLTVLGSLRTSADNRRLMTAPVSMAACEEL